MKEEIEKLKKRIEELEKRPVYYPVYSPIIYPQSYDPNGITRPWCCQCGKNYPHTCITC